MNPRRLDLALTHFPSYDTRKLKQTFEYFSGQATTTSSTVVKKQVNYIIKGTQCKNPIICSFRSSSWPKESTNKHYVFRKIRKLLRKNAVPAISVQDNESLSSTSSNWTSIIKDHLNSLYQFSRPHTVIGTVSTSVFQLFY